MNSPHPRSPAALRVPRSFALLLFLAAIAAYGQSVTADPATLAQYDANRNGRLDREEIAAMDAARGVSPPITSKQADETVVLSPFEVTDAGNRGYYGANTMSGTRLNSKVEDLAASLTVVTKEQMADFAMLDINDVFLYEAGTEGTGTYTEFSVDRNGSVADNSLNPNSANRVRGVGPANISFGNFETAVPIDPINVDGLEISRGPNSNIFGLGNAGGSVNMVPASANLSRDRSQVSLRGDSFDGYRGSFDLNRVLKKGILALRGSGVYQHDGFVRKPSGTDTKRLNGMLRYQPFKYTSVTASHSYYHIDGNRPNTTMPRDAVTSWKNAGSPTWDPLTTTARINGVIQPGAWSATVLPAYFSNADFRSNSTLFINHTGEIGFWSPSRTTSTTNPNTGNQNVVLVNTVPDPIRLTQPLFSSDPSVSSKDLYDWSSINLAAVNRISNSTGTTLLQLEQIFLDTPRHMLAMQAAYFRDDSYTRGRNPVGRPGSSGATGFLHVDVNERMIDGSPNPFFLRPFIGIYGVNADTENHSLRQTSRVQLAYRLDLRAEKGLMRWLGMHQFSGYGEYKDSLSRSATYRDFILSNNAWNPAPSPGQAISFARPNIALNYYRYYLGDNVGQNVEYAPRDYSPGQYNYRWGNGVTGQFVTEPLLLGPGYQYGATFGTSRSLLKTQGAVVQSHLLRGRVVTTFGLRVDSIYNKEGATPTYTSGPGGITLDYDSVTQQAPGDWVHNEGRTKTAGVVLKPTAWLHLHANVSDSFQPAGYAVGLFLNPLPNPSGKGEDYGFSLNLFDGKLVARVNRYNTTQINTRNGSARTLAQRVRIMDFEDPGNASRGLTIRARNWVTNAAAAQGRTLTPDEINRQVASLTGIDLAYLTRPESVTEQRSLVAETGDVVAKGTELELNFNPSHFCTAKLNVTETEAIDSRLSPGVTNWIAQRMPVWTSLIDPEIGRPWYTERYGGQQSAAEYLADQVTSQLAIATANLGKSRPQIRKYRANLSASYRLAGITEQKSLKRFTVGGALRWEDKGAIGYYGIEQPPAIVTALDPNRPVYDKAHLYADAFVAYRTRFFANKVGATLQLNVRNLHENGRLQAISAYPDGSPNGYRIVDPRQFILTATFDL